MKTEIRTIDSLKGKITIYKLTNKQGAIVELSSLGAGILSIIVPDKKGKMDDVVLGYENPIDYIYDGPCAGKIAGRYANRIANGHLEINGKLYQLNKNCGPNSLHGGPEGFQNQIWASEMEQNKVIFTYRSHDGEEFFPGNLTAVVTYEWNDDNTLRIDLRATTDAETVVNLTNHTYFNLKGEGNGNIFDHKLILNSDHYLATDDTLVPTGEYTSVENTPMDFSIEKAIGKDIRADFKALHIGKGYDHCWLVNDSEEQLKSVAVLSEESSGRELHISSTQVGVQVYTGNWLNGSPRGKNGHVYTDYSAVAIECQGLPDAPNKPQFPSQSLKPGDEYHQIIIFSFKNK